MGFRVAISYHECWSKFALDLDERIGARRQLFVLAARVSGLRRGPSHSRALEDSGCFSGRGAQAKC